MVSDSTRDPSAPAKANIVLAPMEGVIDAHMRRFLTGIGGYGRCVTEFVRVTNVLLPERVVPVYTQLLGSNADALAVNAKRAVTMGAPGIDLNFGCPAKTVNNSMGGSVLLRQPAQVASIVAIVRDAVPAQVPVTAKIRLGYENHDQFAEIVARIRNAGATELAIHARTKFDGYKPPAWWSTVRQVMHEGQSNTYINGEIWTVEESLEAQRQSGCTHIMLGRGALAAPDLALRIRQMQEFELHRGKNQNINEAIAAPMPWKDIVERVERQFACSDCLSARHVGNRTKQWLAYLKRSYPEANDLFALLRTLHDVKSITQAFATHRTTLQ